MRSTSYLKCSSCFALMANFVYYERRFARGHWEAANLGERSAGGSGSGEAQKQFAAAAGLSLCINASSRWPLARCVYRGQCNHFHSRYCYIMPLKWFYWAAVTVAARRGPHSFWASFAAENVIFPSVRAFIVAARVRAMPCVLSRYTLFAPPRHRESCPTSCYAVVIFRRRLAVRARG
jgi:hypothetical protein